MKVLLIIGTLTASIAALKSDRVQEASHNLFGFFFCCQGSDRETCGVVFDSCCQKGKCKTALGISYCPDRNQFKC